LLLRKTLKAAPLFILLSAAAPTQADPVLPLLSVVPPTVSDSLAMGTPIEVQAARTGYQAAWDLRQGGDFAGAIRACDATLEQVESALEGELDASTRRDLTEYRSKLTGLRNAARGAMTSADRDSVDAAARREVADASDPRVLNAPAMEEIQPQLNADVVRWIEFFTGTGRSVFERWLKRSGRYMELFRTVLQKEGLPPDLVHLVFVESGFNIQARSYSAAVGPWQFLRSTARLFGLTVNQWVDERRDPEKSTVAAARYLKHLYAIFGDWPLALASYNAGEGTVLRAIKRQGTTNYWDLHLPRQTEEYVPQFMAVLAISREPEKYGFDAVEQDEPMDFDELALTGAVDLRAIAKLAECPLDEIKLLNPAVLRHAAPGRDGITMVRVPRGKAAAIMAKLGDGATLPAVNLTVQHRVRRGETLQTIANQYHVSAQDIARANHVSRAHPLKRGTVLTVPASFRAPAAAELEENDPRGSTAYVPSREFKTPPSLNAESDAEGRSTHVVRKGETLASIADQYSITVADIRRWNKIPGSTVRRGTRLKIRTGDAAVTTPEMIAADSARVAAVKAPTPSRRGHARMDIPARATVTVQAGETLGVLAQRHGTTIARLKAANGLVSSRIHAGQRLRIPS
jgi:membrane-bound lytic murein transglycosylase D